MRSAGRLLLLSLLAPAFFGPSGAIRIGDQQSPVTRVVKLLQDLQKQIVEEGKAEGKLFQKFVCWAKMVIEAKEASNADAGSRLEMLNKYLSDLDNGRIELTSERTDLESDVEEVNGNMQMAEDMRKKEHEDYEGAKSEMEQAIAALTAAIEVLTTATKDHKEGVLLGVSDRLDSSLGTQTEQAAAMSRAVELGQKFLTKADALFLQRLLTGEVPTADWEKLNRPATFKKSYKARSFKIQNVLAKLLATFESNLAEAKKKEGDAKTVFEKLMGSKKKEKDAAQDALGRLDGERGAAGVSQAEAADEAKALEKQIDDDKQYILDLKDALAKKTAEWEARRALRAGELEAISKAISILHADDARDLFSRSLASQEKSSVSLLQQGQVSTGHQKRRSAIAAIKMAGHESHDSRLTKLATRLASGGEFDEVITAIDEMLDLLDKEAQSDFETKEKCEDNRMKDTREAAVSSRKMDEMSESITRLQSEIQDLTASITSKTKQVSDIEKELAEAKSLRESEHAEFLKNKKDDTDAKDLVQSAYDVLHRFYTSNELMLSEQRMKVGSKQPAVKAGEAPPPPPSTWEKSYGGKVGESRGILDMLSMIKKDIQADISAAIKEDKGAELLYQNTKQEMDLELESLQTQITNEEESKGTKEQKVQTNKAERRLKQGTLEATMKKISAATPGCIFFTVNFPVRTRNRDIEKDGLLKAKVILSGSK